MGYQESQDIDKKKDQEALSIIVLSLDDSRFPMLKMQVRLMQQA